MIWDFWHVLGWLGLILGDSKLIWNGFELIWNWCERGCEWWQTLLRYDQVGQKIKISGLRKWDEIVWISDETVDANHFWASTFCPSLIQCDLERCVKEC